MANVLVSWVGQTDLQASRGNPSAGAGPIGQTLAVRGYDEVVLISNYPAEETKDYATWARARTTARLSFQTVVLDDPTDFLGIYRVVDPLLRELTTRFEGTPEELRLSLHLSPGTPAMATMWMLLGKTRYPAELIQSSKEKGVRTAAVPFDIVAEFIEMVPRVTAQPDAALSARSAGSERQAAKFGDIVYRGRAMANVVERARKVAARNVAVLLEGETGTGKELMARAIHDASPRSLQPFVAVNCGAIPAELVESELFGHRKGAFTNANADRPGHFRAAKGGTLFLDEIGELPLDAQVKLLRALQQGEVVPVGESTPVSVDVRIIAATNRNLAREVQERRFRGDLFYRLAVAVIHLPPLRERAGDIGPLIDAFLNEANVTGQRDEPGFIPKRLSTAARALLMAQRWPGNVRELEHTLMRATVWADQATISEAELRAALFQGGLAPDGTGGLPSEIEEGFDLETFLDGMTRHFIELAMSQTQQNKTRAARLLGLNSHQVLTARMEKVGVGAPR